MDGVSAAAVLGGLRATYGTERAENAPRLATLDFRASPGTMQYMVMPEGFLTQMRKGALPYCVLAVLGGREMYGLELVRTLAQVDGMVLSEGTLYPLLSRLRKENLVDTTWEESASGPPRRYYRLTSKGRRALAGFTTEWQRFRAAVDTLLDDERKGS